MVEPLSARAQKASTIPLVAKVDNKYSLCYTMSYEKGNIFHC